MAKAASTAHRPVPDTSAWKNLAAPPRDPKARARSREYLKQCLQEITYLTSPGALNPLPTRAPVSIDESNGEAGVPERPRKTLSEQPLPSKPASEPEAKDEQSAAQSTSPAAPAEPAGPTSQAASEAAGAATATTVQEAVASTDPSDQNPSSVPNGSAERNESQESSAVAAGDAPPSSPAPRTVALPESELPSGGSPPGLSVIEPPRQQLTAIYKPESKAAWREELRAANEAASKVPWPPGKTSDEEQLAGLTLIDEDIKAEEAAADGDRVWTTRRALKSHLDIVRGVALAHGPDLILATGGDDCTVKVWALDAPSVMSTTYRPLAASELEPAATYRGHTEPVLAVAVSSALGLVFSGSADSTIRVWKIAARSDDPYAPYDPSKAVATLEGHTDAVWDVCLLPARPTANGAHGTKPGAESQLVSVSADGTAKLWEEKDGRWSLQASFSEFEGATPTCVSGDNQDFGRVLVGLSNGLVKLYSLEDGSELQSFGEEGSQVNAILSHPTLPLVVTGHEDGHLRFFDSKTGELPPPPTRPKQANVPGAQTSSLLAHPKPITSLSLSPLSPTCVLSASVDCSVRLWDLQRKTSLQDLNGHRQRSNEGVTDVASHPELPIIASAGADGVVRIWGAG
jgi:striatin 1/3/4